VLVGTVVITMLVILLVGLLTRKGLVYLLWPFIFAYPHAVWEGLLPLNAGFDDLFILFVFVLLLLKGRKCVFGWAGKMVWAYFALVVFGEFTGMFLTTGVEMIALKTILKTLVTVIFGMTMLMAMETEQDVRRMFLSYMVALGLACVIALADWYGMGWTRYFVILDPEKVRFRATGSFLSPAGVGMNLSLAFFPAFCLLLYQSRGKTKLLMALWCMLLAVTVVASQSRTGITAIGAVLTVMLLLSRRRLLIVPILVVAAASIWLLPDLREAVLRRWVRTVQQARTGSLFEGTGRLAAIRNSMEISAGPWTMLCGSGKSVLVAGGELPHNGYLDVILVHGLAGVAWYIAVTVRMLRQGAFLRRHAGSFFSRSWSTGVNWGILAVLVAALASDPVVNQFMRFALFYLMASLTVLMKQTCGQEKPLPAAAAAAWTASYAGPAPAPWRA